MKININIWKLHFVREFEYIVKQSGLNLYITVIKQKSVLKFENHVKFSLEQNLLLWKFL